MKYNLLCFQTSGRLIIFFNKHDYQVSTSLMKQNKRYKGLKTAKWISIWDLVPGLFLTVRSAGWGDPLQSFDNPFLKMLKSGKTLIRGGGGEVKRDHTLRKLWIDHLHKAGNCSLEALEFSIFLGRYLPRRPAPPQNQGSGYAPV